MLPQAASDFYRAQQRITAVSVALVRRQWRRMGGDWDASWSSIRADVVKAIAAGQIVGVGQVGPYVTAVLDEFGDIDAPVAGLRSAAFAGVTGEGRPLPEVLDVAVIRARTGGSLEAGGKWLDLVTQSAIADSSRSATSTAMAVRPNVVGYARMLNPPSCSRCAILAGKVYKWNDGFLRHPGCDCRHIPRSEAMPGDPTTDPKAYFDSLSASDQNKIFTNAGAEAIREGADIGQVVNARGGRRSGLYTTADGALATRQGARRGIRLMPEAIFDQARTRDEAVELLGRYGFIT